MTDPNKLNNTKIIRRIMTTRIRITKSLSETVKFILTCHRAEGADNTS